MIDHRSYIQLKQLWNWKKKIQTHDLYDTGAALYQLSYQANWELATYIPVDDKEYKWIYERSYLWT